MHRGILFFVGAAVVGTLHAAAVYQANGIKIGEVTQSQAVVWTRLTEAADARRDGTPFVEVAKHKGIHDAVAGGQIPPGKTLAEMQYAVPGAAGSVRVQWWPEGKRALAQSTDWTPVAAAADFTAQVPLKNLHAGTHYELAVESRDASGQGGASVEGKFMTPPEPSDARPIRFVITTCHDDWRRDNEQNGFDAYAAITAWRPDFFVHTGDYVYLDKYYPFAVNAALARFKWNRTSAWPFVREFYRGTSSYFIKDDHDILKNDTAPGETYGDLNFKTGLDIEYEQLPMPRDPPYRRVRWGRHLEVWLIEGREFRHKKGGQRTLLGPEQKRWLMTTLTQSDATFKVVISGDAIVGPNVDYKKGDKGDSLSDEAFEAEGAEIRSFLAAQKNVFVVAGDRHWQYHSVDPKSGLNEFGCGPFCFGMAEGFVNKVRRSPMHRFLRIDGGFFSGEIALAADGTPSLTLQHHDTHGAVVYEYRWPLEGAPRE
ncbi:MAG: alkaline phosphatase D family protein [Candidatus Didemnitutus sp.]|nr:alkaline phosphatase D family protein [Candidatus Didemnitutus sp.]